MYRPLFIEPLEERLALASDVPSLLKDITLASADGHIAELTDVSGIVYFVANDGVHGAELWRSDGTFAGTTIVKDLVPGPAGSYPQSLLNVAGELFF